MGKEPKSVHLDWVVLATVIVEIRASAWVIVEASKIELLHVNFI